MRNLNICFDSNVKQFIIILKDWIRTGKVSDIHSQLNKKEKTKSPTMCKFCTNVSI